MGISQKWKKSIYVCITLIASILIRFSFVSSVNPSSTINPGFTIGFDRLCECYEDHISAGFKLWEFDANECSELKSHLRNVKLAQKVMDDIQIYLQYDLSYILAESCLAYRKDYLLTKDSVYMSLSKYDTLDYTKFFNENPNHFLIPLRKGEELMSRGKYEEALEIILEVSDKLPRTVFPKSELIYLYFKTGATNLAIEQLKIPYENESVADKLERRRWLASILPMKEIIDNSVSIQFTSDSDNNIDVVVSAGRRSIER